MPGLALTLLCHAPTPATRLAAFPADEAVDGLGLAAAASVRLRRVDTVLCSPARRAQQTAAAMGLVAAVDPLLREMEFGAWSQHTLDSIATTDPAGMASWLCDPAATPHGGESIADLLGRVALWLDGVAERNGRIAAITHATVMRAALVNALNADPAAFWRIDIAPLCVMRLDRRADRWILRSLSGPGATREAD